MKFWPCALILIALLLGGWVASRSPERVNPDCVGHFVGTHPSGVHIELSLHSSAETPGSVEGVLRWDGEIRESVRGTVRWSRLSAGTLTGRFRDDDAGNRVLDLGPLRLVRVATDSHLWLERPGLRVDCAHPLVTRGPPSLRKAIQRANEDAFESVRGQFRDLGEEIDETGPPRVGLYWEETWNLAVRTEQVVSLFGTAAYYTGGAHPNSHFKTRTFWVDGGVTREIRLSDLFNPCTDWLDEVSQRVIGQVREAGASSVVEGRVARFDENDLGCWAMTSAGITVDFAPYQLGCYAEGAFSAIVKYEDIRGFLNPVGPASEFLR
jgi:hypothetical protein